MDTAPHNAAPSLTDGSRLRALHRLATPMLVGAVLSNLQSVINLFWVGRLGPQAVAAVAVGGTILMLLFPALMGLSTGTVALVARAIGAGRRDEAAAAAGQSLSLAVALGLLSGFLGWYVSDDLFRLLGAAPDIVADGEAYLRINLLGSFSLFLFIIASAALQGAGDARTPMWLGLGANGLNIALDPLLIYGWGPVPALGVRGAALASVIAETLAAIVAAGVLLGGRAALHIGWSQCRPRLALAWRILRIGIPGSGQMLARSLMGAVLMRIVAGCGTAAVAAYGTGLRFHMLILMPAFALGGAAATLVGQNLGAGKPGRARQAAWLATGLDLLIMLVVIVLLAGFAPALIRAFNRDPDVVRIGASYLRIVSPFYFFAAFGVIIGRALNGAGDSLAPMIITTLSLWGLQVPLALWLVRWWQPATAGIWWAVGLASAVNGLLMTLWFETGRWQQRRV